ncbi:hypothetical protein [Streptomyces lanatus]|uniref:Uncharacterized protein n=1 Tax=Streptomyces lanatus TaxID=66900 RepID=A0ABV1Y5G2_9ACTN|nr:hypothetical protein [Streptomyces lanatus]
MAPSRLVVEVETFSFTVQLASEQDRLPVGSKEKSTPRSTASPSVLVWSIRASYVCAVSAAEGCSKSVSPSPSGPPSSLAAAGCTSRRNAAAA